MDSNFVNQTGYPNYPDFMEQYRNRTFQNPSEDITGRSVVLERNDEFDNNMNMMRQMWPYSLAEYLQKYIGKAVQIEYALPNGRYAAKKGEIRVVGTNFLGLKPFGTPNLFLVDLSSIISIDIVNCRNSIDGRNLGCGYR